MKLTTSIKPTQLDPVEWDKEYYRLRRLYHSAINNGLKPEIITKCRIKYLQHIATSFH